jgi:hypothetical protein
MRIADAFVKSGLSSEIVTVDLPDVGEVKVEVRGKTVDQQYDLIERCRKPDGEINGKMLAVETIIATAYEPGTDEQAFEPAHRDMLLSKDASAFGELLAAANKAAGLGTEEEAVADLAPTPPAVTSTG